MNSDRKPPTPSPSSKDNSGWKLPSEFRPLTQEDLDREHARQKAIYDPHNKGVMVHFRDNDLEPR